MRGRGRLGGLLRLMGRGWLLLVMLVLVVDHGRPRMVLRMGVVGRGWQALLGVGVMLEEFQSAGCGGQQKICTKEDAQKQAETSGRGGDVSAGMRGCKLRSGSAAPEELVCVQQVWMCEGRAGQGLEGDWTV